MDDFVDEVLADVTANVTGSLAPGGRYACPVDGCTQVWVIPEVITQMVDVLEAPAGFDAPGPLRVQYVGVARTLVERTIGGHLERHPPEDWVLTIAVLRNRVRELEAERECLNPLGIMPIGSAFLHVSPTSPEVHLVPVPVWGPMVQRWRR